MFAIFAGTCAMAWSLPTKAAFMPLLIGVPGAILCAAQLVIDLRRKLELDVRENPQPGGSEGARSEAEVFIWLALFTGAILGFGFVVGGPIIVGAYVKFSGRDSWRNALFAAGGTFAVLYGVFIWLLELSMFQGLVLQSLLG
ncbi:MAG: tripartite tricarboxylate transporter TctB family protein [Paracoccaceae bacterium]